MWSNHTSTPSPDAAVARREDNAQISDPMQEFLKGIFDPTNHNVQFSVGRDFGPVKLMTARKELLAMKSAVFYAMFYGGLAENCKKTIDIPDVVPQAFSNILFHVQMGAVSNLNAENALSTLSCADKYDVPQLVDLCYQFIRDKLCAWNCLTFLEEAVLYCNDNIIGQSLDIVDACTEAVFRSKAFPTVEFKTLNMILERNTLSAKEAVIYEATQRWATAACKESNLVPSADNRRSVLGEAFFLLRFPLFGDVELAKGPVKDGILSDAEFTEIQLWRDAETKPLLPFPTEPRSVRVFQIGNDKFQLREEVFVSRDENGHWWFGGEVIGVDNQQFVVAGFGGREYKRKFQQLKRSREFLFRQNRVLVRVHGKYFTIPGGSSFPWPGSDLDGFCEEHRVSVRDLVVPRNMCWKLECRQCRFLRQGEIVHRNPRSVSFEDYSDGNVDDYSTDDSD